MKSVFREDGWVNDRTILNPSKWKEYPLHATGWGFLNRTNFIPEYTERFTHVDMLSDEELNKLHRFTRLFLQRKSLGAGDAINLQEKELLEKHGFRLERTWGTLLINLTKPIEVNRMIERNVKKGEKVLDFSEVVDEDEFKEYYSLLVKNRGQERMATPEYKEFQRVWKNEYYHSFIARDKETGRVVAGMGLIHNYYYAFEYNLARDKSVPFVQDYLKFKVLEELKKEGVVWYDLAGVNPNPSPNEKDFYIKQYKEKWSHDYYCVYEYVRGLINIRIKLNDTSSFHRKLLKILPPKGKIADVGCGRHKITPNAVGYDIIDGVDKQINLLDIQEKDEYDTVYCIGTLYLLEPEQMPKIAEVLKGMLKKGGSLLITAANPESIFRHRFEFGRNRLTKKEFAEYFPGCTFTTVIWGSYLVCIWRKP